MTSSRVLKPLPPGWLAASSSEPAGQIPQVERRLITAFLGRSVDGIVVSPVVSDENVDLYNWLLARGFPIIFVDRHLPEVKCSYITTDNYKGALLGVLHLIDQGYRRIVCLENGGPLALRFRNG